MKTSSVAMIVLLFAPFPYVGRGGETVERRRVLRSDETNALSAKLVEKRRAVSKIESETASNPSVPKLYDMYVALVDYRDELLRASESDPLRKPVRALETTDAEFAVLDQKCAMLNTGLAAAASAVESMAEERLEKGDVADFDRLSALALKMRLAVANDSYSSLENYSKRIEERVIPDDKNASRSR